MVLREHASCGLDFVSVPDITVCLNAASEARYEFIVAPLYNPCLQREFLEGPASERKGPQSRSDMVLTSKDWCSLIVGKLSPWLQLDSPNDILRQNSEKAIMQELNFASHLGVPAIMISLNSSNCINLARTLNEHIQCGNNHQYWIKVPLAAPVDELDDIFDHDNKEDKVWVEDTWTWYNKFRSVCESNKKMGIALEFTADLPTIDILDRWIGESVKCIIIPTTLFLTNKRGFPVLSRAHQTCVKKFFKMDVQVVISGHTRHSEKGLLAYQQYLDHLWQNQDPPSEIEKFARGYEDYLQCPLQPLKDNLESQTYEIFEKDPIKYRQYQEAVYHALIDKVPSDERNHKTIVLMVLGAGRGPLVTESLAAASRLNVNMKVYAIEKNKNAIVTLENLKAEVWGSQVTIINTDMREFDPPEQADIIVSELLGSFGDNELSPECLDGAMKCLKEDGISIPTDYTSFIAPLSSTKLWNEARICKDVNKHPDAALETPYVVRLHNVHIIDKPKPLFTFEHPSKNSFDNNRYKILKFSPQVDTVIHGFAGYFESTLYDDVKLSINPETHSNGMVSWFPLYIPLREPMHVRGQEEITVHFWRRCSDRSVWYEWTISSPHIVSIHNPKGSSFTIDL